MTLPRLLHPVSITIEPLRRSESVVDNDYREPVQQASHGPKVDCPGQVKWGQDERLRGTLAGAEQESDGYVLFRRTDLRAAGIAELKQNDRIVSMGSGANKRDVDLYVTGLRIEGHYPDQAGGAMIKAYFRDRFPSKQKRGGTPAPPATSSTFDETFDGTFRG